MLFKFENSEDIFDVELLETLLKLVFSFLLKTSLTAVAALLLPCGVIKLFILGFIYLGAVLLLGTKAFLPEF